MKKILGLCLAILTVVLLFSACSASLSDEDFIGVWEEPSGRFRVIIRDDGTGEHVADRGYDQRGVFVPSGEYISAAFEWERRGNDLIITLTETNVEKTVSINRGVLRVGTGLAEYRRVSLTY